jgi:hypothetical protein
LRYYDEQPPMFTVYIDDSGTDPKQPTAIAAALIVPAKQIPALDRDWAVFGATFGFGDFHASDCAARNPHSAFGEWGDEKVSRAFRRARQIMKRRASKALTVTLHKKDFDAEVPQEWLDVGGGENHFTWAFRELLYKTVKWGDERNISASFEYIFDWAGKNERVEIDMVMAQFESARPGRYEGRFSFRKRQEVPGLQCVDLLAWTIFSLSRSLVQQLPTRGIADESFRDFTFQSNNPEWLVASGHTRETMRAAIARDRANAEAEHRRREWYRNYEASLAEKKKPKTAKSDREPR